MKVYQNQGYFYATFSAVLFGASIPAAKMLLTRIDPWLLAGLLYFGSAIGLGILFSIQQTSNNTSFKQAPLKSSDWKWLGGAILFGGMLGPTLLMVGLFKANASSASLLLNLESVCTALIAWTIFKEHTDRRLILGMVFIVMGCLILTWKGHFE
jgi:drug/metabolite transporter (DMT)-like permease